MTKSLVATTVRQYLERIEEIEREWKTDAHGKPMLWYRGIQKSYWELVPTLYRADDPLKDLLQIEDEIREEFVRRAPSLTEHRPHNSWEWYFLMQHYGAPTRLLDWSENPLFGLYFAVKDSEGLNDAAVWVLDAWRLNQRPEVVGQYEVIPPGSPGLCKKDARRYRPWLPDRFDAKQQLRRKFPVCVYPNQFDRRIAAQRSCFTLHGRGKKSLNKLFPPKMRLLAKILIPSYVTGPIWEALSDCGVDEATIYPDLEGLGKSVRDWMPAADSMPHDGVCVRLRPSNIHGVGVFAIKPIKKGTMIFPGDSDEMRWVEQKDLPKAACLRDFYDRFAIFKNGQDGQPRRYGCPRCFNRLTMSWYLNDPRKGKKPNVRCDGNYDFWALRNINCDEELTVNSTDYSDHADDVSITKGRVQKKSKK